MSEVLGMIRDGREQVAGLRRLGRVRAPAGLRGAVLREIGLADGYWAIESPIGPAFVAFNQRGISAVLRAPDAATFEARFHEEFGRTAYPVDNPPPHLVRGAYRLLRGERASVPFDLSRLSEFERAVLVKTAEIPYGQVRPYHWVAREIGHPRAQRAVGSALAKNPIPLLIPCHRVIRSDGQVGNYGLDGSANKRRLLEAEGIPAGELERMARGVRYYGSDTTHIYCFPTCRHARRISDAHRVAFYSDEETRLAGYRACKVCRPAVAS